MSVSRPITLLICAMGGEGGGVLTDWIVGAAQAQGLAVQSTSVPGVAQRTGATTYYVEIHPEPGIRPVFALAPGLGDVDLVVATELMEAARAASRGLVTPDRTRVIASTHRVHAVAEKMAMADGRYDDEALHVALAAASQSRLLFDMERAAKSCGAVVNAVLLGAIAGCGLLPIAPETFAAAIRAGGKAVDSNLKGFDLGLSAARGHLPSAEPVPTKRPHPDMAGTEALMARLSDVPEAARAVAAEGVKRLVAYQDRRYAGLYLDRLAAFPDPVLAAVVARHLAVRMSFEDVIRVAQFKTAPERIERIRAEIAAQPGQPVVVRDFLKPGLDEICGLLPGMLARPILALARRHGKGHAGGWGRQVNSTGMLGFASLWLLARLKPWRRFCHRFAEENREIEAWLDEVERAAIVSPLLAREIADCARLVKGYGETWRRGADNLVRIRREVITPALARNWPPGFAIDAVTSARTAAQTDPEGEGLGRALAAIAGKAAGLSVPC